MPIIGGPGPRTFRQEAQEYRRIFIGWVFLAGSGLVSLGLLWFNLIMWGPISGYLAGSASLLLMGGMAVARDKNRHGFVHWFTWGFSAAVLALWLIIGLEIAANLLPPWEIVWAVHVKCVAQVVIFMLLVVTGFVEWAVFVEIVDPEHSMRHSGPEMSKKLEPIYPWSTGIQGRDVVVETVEIPARSLQFERKRDDGGWDYGEIPCINTREWWVFIRAVLNDLGNPEGVTFSEPHAKNFGIGQAEYIKVRDAMLDAGLLRWRDDGNHRNGTTPSYREADFWRQYVEHSPPPPKQWYVQRMQKAGFQNE